MLSTFALDAQVIQEGLCTSCGACQGLCPYWDSVKGRTVTDFDCVREDGRCQRFCPRMPTDLDALRAQAFPGETILEGIGPFRSLLLTRAADPAIREGAQHGGTVTALTELALEEGLIDAAVLTRAGNTLDPEGVLVTDAAGVRACSGSSFQIAPTLAVLNRALREDRYHQIGLVATPCKALAVCKMKHDRFLHGSIPPTEAADKKAGQETSSAAEGADHGRSIGLVIGLFCGWGLDWEGLEELAGSHTCLPQIRHMDIPPSKYHSLEITSGGCPGGSGEKISIDLDQVIPLVRNACHYCDDMTCEFSDISVGGARSGDGWEVDKKWNQLIVRTKRGEDLIERAREKGVLEFKELPDGALEKLQRAAAGKKQTARSYWDQKNRL